MYCSHGLVVDSRSVRSLAIAARRGRTTRLNSVGTGTDKAERLEEPPHRSSAMPGRIEQIGDLGTTVDRQFQRLLDWADIWVSN